jgi:hypothetical protein
MYWPIAFMGAKCNAPEQRVLKAGMNPSTPKKLPTLLLEDVDL